MSNKKSDELSTANRTLTFQVGGVSATGVTNASGVATASITLTSNEASGPNSLPAGSSFAKTFNVMIGPVAPKGTNETTSVYLAWLSAADQGTLPTTATLNWTDSAGNAYRDVGQQIFTAHVHLPVLNSRATSSSHAAPE